MYMDSSRFAMDQDLFAGEVSSNGKVLGWHKIEFSMQKAFAQSSLPNSGLNQILNKEITNLSSPSKIKFKAVVSIRACSNKPTDSQKKITAQFRSGWLFYSKRSLLQLMFPLFSNFVGSGHAKQWLEREGKKHRKKAPNQGNESKIAEEEAGLRR